MSEKRAIQKNEVDLQTVLEKLLCSSCHMDWNCSICQGQDPEEVFLLPLHGVKVQVEKRK